MKCFLRFWICLFGILWLLGSTMVSGQSSEEPRAPEKLRVGVRLSDPIAMQIGDQLDGIAVELWREIIQGEGQPYELFAIDSRDPIEVLVAGEADVVLGVRPAAKRVGQVRYTQPFITPSLAYATIGSTPSMWKYAKAFFTTRLAWATLSVSAVLLAVGALCWLAERRGNPEQFRSAPRQGLWDGFYWAGVTMTTIGYGDKVPMTTLGKIVALLWMLAAIGVSSVLTASVVSVVDQVRSEGAIENFPADLEGQRVLVVEDSAAAAFLAEYQIEHEVVETVSAALERLTSDRADVVVDSEIGLRSRGNDLKSAQIVSTHLRPQGYAIAVAADREALYQTLQRRVLEETSEPDWSVRVRRFVRGGQ